MKKAVLHATTLMHCKAKHGLHNLFSTNEGRSYVEEATKINLKNLKTKL